MILIPIVWTLATLLWLFSAYVNMMNGNNGVGAAFILVALLNAFVAVMYWNSWIK